MKDDSTRPGYVDADYLKSFCAAHPHAFYGWNVSDVDLIDAGKV